MLRAKSQARNCCIIVAFGTDGLGVEWCACEARFREGCGAPRLADSMTDASVQFFAVALATTWCGFGLYGLARMAARSPQGREMLERLRRSGPLGEAAALALLVTVVAIGGTKPEGGNQPRNTPNTRNDLPSVPSACSVVEEPAFGLVEVRTEGVALRAEPTNSVEAAAWRLRGASEDGIWIECEKPFFALGTNPVRRVYASASGALSFGSARHPPIGAALPDSAARSESSPHLETGLAQRLCGDASPHLEAALVPFRAPLGLLPAAVETNAAPSRFWHAPTPDGGLLVSWENVLVDRLPGRRATIQAELRPNGDFTYRYDFADALDPPATNFAIGAQAGTNAVNALYFGPLPEGAPGGAGRGSLSASVWRVNGGASPPCEPQSIADLLCTNGALRTPARFELEWKNTTEVGDGDSDGDGLSDWDEVFIHGTDPRRVDTDGDSLSDSAEVLAGANPLDADENNDGIPDGADPAAWAADPLWAANATNDSTSITIMLNAAIPADASASLVVGDLCIPLRSPGSWTLALVPGVLYAYRLHTSGAEADLSIAPATSAPPQRSGPSLRSVPAPFPFWTDDPDGVFDGPSGGGSGEMAVPTLELAWIDPGDGSHASPFGICLHDRTDARFAWRLLPAVLTGRIGDLVLETLCFDHRDLVLAVAETATIVEGAASLPEGSLRFGRLRTSVWAHLCDADYWDPGCFVCGLHECLYEEWHDVDYLTAVPNGLAGGREIVRFPGAVTRTFDPTASPVPDLHQPYFYEDARTNVLPDSVYDDVSTTGYMTPADEPPGSISFSWRCVEGPSGPLPETASGSWASFLLPLQGGVYRFRFQCGSLPPGDAVLVLPLAGASVDDVVAAEIVHADQFAAKVNQKYPWLLRNAPVNGLKWFWHNGAGDFLGRPDNASSRTVWFYNQVNDDSGMGAVCTWGGRCVRIAKLSNFICGYACRKIGVEQMLQEISQGSGTSNDQTAYSSWRCGEALAAGTMTLDGCASRIGQLSWDSGDQKVRRLWPNLDSADNFVSPSCYYNQNTQFTAPGFLYMEDP